MNQNPTEFWNLRYGNEEFIYGEKPNKFFKEQLDKLKPASILLPAEGEGRNAVYAASRNWDVVAFDISENGKKKATRLSEQSHVFIDYKVTEALDFKSPRGFDVIGLIYTHFPSKIRQQTFEYLQQFLKVGGTIIFEGFSKAQLGNASGVPKDKEMLFSIEEIKMEFPEIEFNFLKEEVIELSEGNYHCGTASVIRFVGIKKTS
ncbi:class I SAM-dependent methyltransferase [Algoriphagus sp. AGSA1]|uniref:class I SAM-dependent methyltransferase n=1 Tax=Algoriphagus sp. AGSA1 TaxID=2907213 RepID=UPI001F48ACED|nr:class I SAM-dependent methyltransferase [Algoriphagus sp. AGSA1]MCE7053938.1 class I SAM-dependent methyltransferase [Algoriphagus sp. AGSA1]